MIRELEHGAEKRYFLGNDNLSCILSIHYGKVELLHFGVPLRPEDADALECVTALGWGSDVLYREEDSSSCLDVRPLAWSDAGRGDYRESPVELELNGSPIFPDFIWKSASITDGISKREGPMPQARGIAETLILTMTSDNSLLNGLELDLIFTLFSTALTRSCVLRNGSENPVTVTKLMSSCMDLHGSFQMTTLNGGWIREAHEATVPVTESAVVNESTNGFSSSRHNPGFLLSEETAGEDFGEVYGFNLIWSGNHRSSAQRSAVGFTRVLQGMSPDGFSRELASGECFSVPEAVLSWSDRGRNGLSQNMHAFVNSCIVPEYWRYRDRPILYNSWEGCMFDFTEAKLLSLARKAKKLGCEFFVLDDGWFSTRNTDTSGLGDYTVNRRKLPGGIRGLAEKVRGLGMDFGLWFEPEAVNPDSDCCRAHPEWVLSAPGNEDLLGRHELLLDLTLPEVRDYIVESVSAMIDDAKISYVKWDMNRFSPVTGNRAYEYILGLYDVLDRIFTPRPQVLLEGCSSGGNRFDLGMLCFAPQNWASDDTDPIERLDIQGGLSLLYPQSTMGAHISAAPHAQTLRQTPLSTRANVAFFGAFGLELNLNQLLPVDETELKETVAFYREHRHTLQFGTFRRNPAEKAAVCWQVTDEKECLAGVFHRLIPAAPGQEWLKLADLRRDTVYSVQSRPQLLRVGQYGGLLKHITPVTLNPNGAIVRTADRRYKMWDGAFTAECSGSALNSGIPLNRRFSGTGYDAAFRMQGDFGSSLFVITEKENTGKRGTEDE